MSPLAPRVKLLLAIIQSTKPSPLFSTRLLFFFTSSSHLLPKPNPNFWPNPNEMAAINSMSFPALRRTSLRATPAPTPSSLLSYTFGLSPLRNGRTSVSHVVVRCVSGSAGADVSLPPPVSETKANFLNSYKRPIPSIYNTVLQELIVQQHLMRYKKTYQYDPVFALGFVTVYDQLMDGYPSDADREAIFKAYIQALKEDPEQYRKDAQKMEEWARAQNANSLCEFSSREGEVENILKDVAARAGGNGNFSYSRFFAVGLFRLIEMANATEPAILEKLCAALNVNKRSVDRDLDVYRGLLSKLVQAKDLLKEYVEREKKKREQRVGENQKADGAMTKCLGEFLSAR